MKNTKSKWNEVMSSITMMYVAVSDAKNNGNIEGLDKAISDLVDIMKVQDTIVNNQQAMMFEMANRIR